mmetsp:Transcript_25653/g.67281  ORF Transcript_25653/g.67281 Transcript_25653/m.67281 type:complete len:218 (+) Transcript_25653:7958-8611(+)
MFVAITKYVIRGGRTDLKDRIELPAVVRVFVAVILNKELVFWIAVDPTNQSSFKLRAAPYDEFDCSMNELTACTVSWRHHNDRGLCQCSFASLRSRHHAHRVGQRGDRRLCVKRKARLHPLSCRRCRVYVERSRRDRDWFTPSQLNLKVHNTLAVKRCEAGLSILSTHESHKPTKPTTGLFFRCTGPHDLDRSQRAILAKDLAKLLLVHPWSQVSHI